MDEFDQPYRTVMDRAKAKAAETWKDEPAAAPVARRRPSAMVNPPALNVPTLAAFAAAAVFALIFAVSIFGGPPAETSEHPSYAAPTAAPAAPEAPPAVHDAAPASGPHSASEAVPALAIEAIDCAAEPGAWGCEPTPVPAPPVVQAAPAGPVAAPVELGPLGCIRVYVTEHAYHTVNPDGSTCYETVTVLGADGSAVELTSGGAALREEPPREHIPADPMSCARRGVGACRGSRP